MITTEDMNTALVSEGLCWTLGPHGAVLRLASDEHANADARNVTTLLDYARLADRKGASAADMAAAIYAKHISGDSTSFDLILAGPDV